MRMVETGFWLKRGPNGPRGVDRGQRRACGPRGLLVLPVNDLQPTGRKT